MPAAQTATGLASSSYMWEDGLSHHAGLHDDKLAVDNEDLYTNRQPLTSQNGNSTIRSTSNPDYSDDEQFADVTSSRINGMHDDWKSRKQSSLADYENSYESVNGERAEDTYRKGQYGYSQESDSDENSKWIHRDKLAKIESEELQAAGIILPGPRDRTRSKSRNRPRRDQSHDKANSSSRSIGGSEFTASRSRKNSTATSIDAKTVDLANIPSWDLRRPEEIMEEADAHSISHGSVKSRIPVAKLSPVPIPSEHLQRDTPLVRKRDGSPGAEDSLTYAKQRSRSGSLGNSLTGTKTASTGTQPSTSQSAKRPESSPKKPAAATTTAKKPTPANGRTGRPKTRGGPSKDSTGSGARPATRSGEREFSSSHSKPMEGEPPWMVSAYRPDPRLPPDQQLLPTVAKRLQQEKWEREGKFGNVYDKEFRPLTDEGFLKPPATLAQDKQGEEEEQPEPDAEKEQPKEEQQRGDWPLRTETKSPTPNSAGRSYSTMPKISDPPVNSPLPSPRTPANPSRPSLQVVRAPEPPEEPEKKKGGCGCCIVM
ncbi:hypothetical protein VTJ83DRAFT_3342 [Remersonia thermophila]|uniref:TeaA receptor TeaR n=1 Tax=Remersonia thermophila TaxID=72144 RepID=A0ABR4DDQ8_9PEZI